MLLYSNSIHAIDMEPLREVATVLTVTDWAQTLDLENHPDLYETNKILGKHPSRKNINMFFISKLVIHYTANHYLKQLGHLKTRTAFNSYQIYVEYNAVTNNAEFGLSKRF